MVEFWFQIPRFPRSFLPAPMVVIGPYTLVLEVHKPRTMRSQKLPPAYYMDLSIIGAGKNDLGNAPIGNTLFGLCLQHLYLRTGNKSKNLSIFSTFTTESAKPTLLIIYKFNKKYVSVNVS